MSSPLCRAEASMPSGPAAAAPTVSASGRGTGGVQLPPSRGATACTRTPAGSVQVAFQRSPPGVEPAVGDRLPVMAGPSSTLGKGTSDTFMGDAGQVIGNRRRDLPDVNAASRQTPYAAKKSALAPLDPAGLVQPGREEAVDYQRYLTVSLAANVSEPWTRPGVATWTT
jgi:hypothetical protein